VKVEPASPSFRMHSFRATIEGPVADRAASHEPIESRSHIRALNSLAVRTLLALFDDREQLFCSRFAEPEELFVEYGVSRTSTLVALLGLRKIGETRVVFPFDLSLIEKAVFQDFKWMRGIGDLGLTLWYSALYAPEQLEKLYLRCNFEVALDFCKDARESHTKELAWFLAGLSHAKRAQREGARDLTDLAVETYRKLAGNQTEEGIFSHWGATARFGGWLGSRFGTFTDQAFAIYALSQFGSAFHVDEPLGGALECASALCALQGPLGQWWCLYDARKGGVACGYPVLSANQAGLAPMALLSLQESTGLDFQGAVHKGLRWLFGENELAKDLSAAGRPDHWVSVTPEFAGVRYAETALSLIGISPNRLRFPSEQMKVISEGSADRCSWTLYSFGTCGLRTT
jgi:hypothetical protein